MTNDANNSTTGSYDRRRVDEIMEAYGAQDAEGAISRLDQNPVPDRLYHYTTIGGLQGIVKSSTLWASDVRYMNDSTELEYAVRLIDEVVADVIADAQESRLREVIPQRRKFANTFEFGPRPFITCFCEHGDLLSQWRGYTSAEVGYSLGLDFHYMTQLDGLPPRTTLRKVVYDVEEQKRLVRNVAETWLHTSEKILHSHPGITPTDLSTPATWALQRALLEHHLCFKHPAFAEEQEWRLIKLVDIREELRLLEDQRRKEMIAAADERMRKNGIDMPLPTEWSTSNAEGVEIKFRPSSLGFIPYVELSLRESAGLFYELLPLKEVIQGPTASPELSLKSLEMYLDSLGYGVDTVKRQSEIPLRR